MFGVATGDAFKTGLKPEVTVTRARFRVAFLTENSTAKLSFIYLLFDSDLLFQLMQ